jgi:hypothetical protein
VSKSAGARPAYSRLVERLVVVGKMHLVNIFTGKLLGDREK